MRPAHARRCRARSGRRSGSLDRPQPRCHPRGQLPYCLLPTASCQSRASKHACAGKEPAQCVSGASRRALVRIRSPAAPPFHSTVPAHPSSPTQRRRADRLYYSYYTLPPYREPARAPHLHPLPRPPAWQPRPTCDRPPQNSAPPPRGVCDSPQSPRPANCEPPPRRQTRHPPPPLRSGTSAGPRPPPCRFPCLFAGLPNRAHHAPHRVARSPSPSPRFTPFYPTFIKSARNGHHPLFLFPRSPASSLELSNERPPLRRGEQRERPLA